MDWRSVSQASGVALVTLVVWWGGILHLDGVLASTLPHHQYEMLSFFYPDVFYPALPGWILAHAQPFAIGVWLVALGWMLGLSVAIGVGAVKYVSGRDLHPTATAFGFVVAVFISVTVIEAAATLL